MLTIINNPTLNPALIPFLSPNQPHIPTQNRPFIPPPPPPNPPQPHPISLPFLSLPLSLPPPSLIHHTPSFHPRPLPPPHPLQQNHRILQLAGRFEPAICAVVPSSFSSPQPADNTNTRHNFIPRYNSFTVSRTAQTKDNVKNYEKPKTDNHQNKFIVDNGVGDESDIRIDSQDTTTTNNNNKNNSKPNMSCAHKNSSTENNKGDEEGSKRFYNDNNNSRNRMPRMSSFTSNPAASNNNNDNNIDQQRNNGICNNNNNKYKYDEDNSCGCDINCAKTHITTSFGSINKENLQDSSSTAFDQSAKRAALDQSTDIQSSSLKTRTLSTKTTCVPKHQTQLFQSEHSQNTIFNSMTENGDVKHKNNHVIIIKDEKTNQCDTELMARQHNETDGMDTISKMEKFHGDSDKVLEYSKLKGSNLLFPLTFGQITTKQNLSGRTDPLRHSIAAILNMTNEDTDDVIDNTSSDNKGDDLCEEKIDDGDQTPSGVCEMEGVEEVDVSYCPVVDNVAFDGVTLVNKSFDKEQNIGLKGGKLKEDDSSFHQERQLLCSSESPSLISRCSSLESIIETDDDDKDNDDDDIISVEDCDNEINYKMETDDKLISMTVSSKDARCKEVSVSDSVEGVDQNSRIQEPIIDSTQPNDDVISDDCSRPSSPLCQTTSHLKRLENLVVKNDKEHFNKDEFFNAKTQILESSQFNCGSESKGSNPGCQSDCKNKESVIDQFPPLEILSVSRRCCGTQFMSPHLQTQVGHHPCLQLHPECHPHHPFHLQILQQQQQQQQQQQLAQRFHSTHHHNHYQQLHHHQQQQQLQFHQHHFHHHDVQSSHRQKQPPNPNSTQKSAFKPISKPRLPDAFPFSKCSQPQPPNNTMNPSALSPKPNTSSTNSNHDVMPLSCDTKIGQSASTMLSPVLQNPPHFEAYPLLRGHSIGYQKSNSVFNAPKSPLISKNHHNTIGAWLSWVRHRYASQAARNHVTQVVTTPTKRTPIAPRYHCESCNKTYSTFGGLSKHRQFHCLQHVKKEFGCKYCTKSYSSLGALKMHIRTHTLPCKCHVCGKAFSRPWLLQGHVRTHTGEKPFRCNHCGRAFADRSNLRAHLQTHAEIKKYACVKCGKTFSRMSLLNKHSDGSCPANVLTCI